MKSKTLSAFIDVIAFIGIVVSLFGLWQYLPAPGTGQQPFEWNAGFLYVAMFGFWGAILSGALNLIAPLSITYMDIINSGKPTR